eukprot:1689445-Prymnesium_polylepis.1
MRRAPHSSTTSPSGCSCMSAGSGLRPPSRVTCGARDNTWGICHLRRKNMEYGLNLEGFGMWWYMAIFHPAARGACCFTF